MCSSLPVGRVIESGRLAGAEWQPWGPWDQCFDNKCLLLFGPGAWCLLCYPYRPWRPAWLRRHVRELRRRGQGTYTQAPPPSLQSTPKGCKASKKSTPPRQSQGCHSNAQPALNTSTIHEWKYHCLWGSFLDWLRCFHHWLCRGHIFSAVQHGQRP